MALLVICLALASSVSLLAQGAGAVRLDVSETLFTVLCAVRAGAPEVVWEGESDSIVTRQVDGALRQLDSGITAPLREFLGAHNFQGTTKEISEFVSLGLMLEGPSDFAFSLATGQLPPGVSELKEFRTLLQDFYTAGKIGTLWRSVEFSYARGLENHRTEIVGALLTARGYLRMIEKPAGRSYTVYPEWLAPRRLASARSYGLRYFVVIHPDREDFAATVRHQYLHLLLDDLVARNTDAMDEFADVAYLFVDRAPRLPDQFRRDALLLIGESLIQAIEIRLKNHDDVEAEQDRREKDGYLFVRHFYRALERFEEAEPSMEFYFPELLRGYRPKVETARFLKTEFAPAEPPSPPAPPRDLVAEILRQANADLRNGDLPAARQAFERVLQEQGEGDPRVLYGLGLVASAEGNRQAAAGYFQRALAQAESPAILGWANLYLGRIYDLEGGREQALGHYRAALSAAGDIERVAQAARRGLAQPFGQENE